MKKLFTFVAAALFAGSMMAATSMTCAEARTAALSVSANNELYNNGEEIEVQAYVTEIAYAWTESAQNMSFWMADEGNGGKVLEAYKCSVATQAEAPEVGDLVKVTGQLTKYNTTPEFTQGCTVVIIQKGAVEPPAGADVVFTSTEFNGQGTSGTGSEVTATKDGVTFTCDKGFGDQYGVRCYKNSVVTISSADQQIGKIVFEFATVSGKYYNGDLPDTIIVNGMEWTNTMTNQARMNKISIYFGEYTPVDPPVVTIDTVNVAEAVEIGMALADNAKTDKEYVVEGYAVQAYAPNEGYTDQTWFMADEAGAYGTFEAYRCTPDYLVENDQYVYVKGKIQKYVKDNKVQIEIGNGTATHKYAQGIENVTLTEKAQKVVVDGVIYVVRDGKMFNLQGAQVR